MSLVLVHGLRQPVVRVGRFAGQYAKPRSADAETRDGATLPSYRGDIVNGPEFELAARAPDPRRLLKAHARSAMTMNFVRALIDGGFADLHHPEYWNLDWVGHSPLSDEYRRMVAAIGDSVRFMETLSGESLHNLNRADFYFARSVAVAVRGSAHAPGSAPAGLFQPVHTLPWIGMRTAALDGARRVPARRAQSIGLKSALAMTPDVVALDVVARPRARTHRIDPPLRRSTISELLPP